MSKSEQSATIVGAGLGGLMLALRLARRGQRVDVYERRTSVDLAHANQRSFTVTLSKRGLLALEQVGLLHEALEITTPLRGRVVHQRDGSTHFVPYGNAAHEQLYAIRRHDMNALLYRATAHYPNLRVHFGQRLVRLDKEHSTLWFQDEAAERSAPHPVAASLIVGSDGVFSLVRQQMQRGERADFRQDFLEWGYKDFFIAATSGGQHAMYSNALHLWPRKNYTFFAFPNFDGTYAGNFICPFDFAERHGDAADLRALTARECPDLLAVAPDLPQVVAGSPMSHLITTYTSQWHYQDSIVLIGDAAHAFTPFWGEGMNSAFEDAMRLDQLLAEHPNQRAHVFQAFQAERKPNTDLIADLAKQNFVELRATTGDPWTVARKGIDRLLYRIAPRYWLPLNIMISHSLMSYCAGYARYQQQRRRFRYCGGDLLVGVVAGWLYLQRLLCNIARKLRPLLTNDSATNISLANDSLADIPLADIPLADISLAENLALLAEERTLNTSEVGDAHSGVHP